MKRKYIPLDEVVARWRQDPEYVAAYDALEEEFALASSLIKARADADMTQEQVAQAMGTTQAGCPIRDMHLVTGGFAGCPIH